MNQRLSWRLAIRNLKAYHRLNLPYIFLFL